MAYEKTGITHPNLIDGELLFRRKKGECTWKPYMIRWPGGKFTRNIKEALFVAGLGIKSYRQPELGETCLGG